MMAPYRKGMRLIGLTYLSQCHYCTSHWISAAVVAAYTPVVGGVFLADLLLAWLALVGGAAVISGLILFFTPMKAEG
jgi:hypothetical protein